MKTFTNKAFFTYVLATLSLQAIAQKAKKQVGKFQTEFHYEHGMLNGKYVSYYDNGTKKSEGAFKDNQRVGEWLVWDKDGNKRMIRKYDNNYTFETVLAKNGKGVDAPSAKINYVFKRSSNGAIIDNKITEKDVAVSKRIWRSIENNTNNKILFDNNLLFI